MPDAAPIRVRFEGARAQASIQLGDRRAAVLHDTRGDTRRWREDLPTYGSLTYRGLYQGIDLRYDGRAGHLKGTYTVAPHSDPAQIAWHYEGAAEVLHEPGSGNLRITLADGQSLVEHAPVAWQDIGTQRVPVAARFVLSGTTVRFALGAYDPTHPLVIDPELVYSTYLGGRGADYGRGIGLDAQGNIYVTGDYLSPDFLGLESEPVGSKDVIVLKLSPDGSEVLYIHLIGSTQVDEGLALTVNAAGEAYIAVDAGAGFPVKNAYQPTEPEAGDGMLVKLDAQGRLAYSTYLGMWLANTFTRRALTLDAAGNVYVVGVTLGQLALVKLSPDGQTPLLELLGTSDIVVRSSTVAVGANGAIYVAGMVANDDLPVTSDAIQSVCGPRVTKPDANCGDDAFLVILDANGTLRYASYLGGSGLETGDGIGIDGAGNIVVAGTTLSPDFPTRNALQPTCPIEPSTESCYYHSFVTKFTPGGKGVAYSTYLGSTERDGQEFVTDIAVDTAGAAYIYGFTNSQRFPVKDAAQPNLALSFCLGLSERVCFDAFVTKLNPTGALAYSTFLGGRFDEYTGGIALDRAGNAYVVGYTEAKDFPIAGRAIQTQASGNDNFFVARIGAGGVIGGTSSKTYLPFVLR